MDDTLSSGQDSYTSANAKVALALLLVVFIAGTLCLQAFNLVFAEIGAALGAPDQASLITAIPGIVLGIVCFVYGSLGDFVPLKKMTVIGMALLVIGSLMGFFVHSSIWLVIIARCIQTAGAQVAGSVFLVIAVRYLEGAEKVMFFGLFTAGYQLSTAIGVLAAGFLTTLDWSYLFLIPVISAVTFPFLFRNLPADAGGHVHVDVPGFVIFGAAIMLLTLFFSYGWMFLIGALALFAVFAIYICKAQDPFITPAFFKNTRWLRSILLIFVFYFMNYSVSPVFNAVGSTLYGLTSAEVSLYLVWGNLAGAAFGIMSGKIVGKIGRPTALIAAAILLIAGLGIAALMVQSGMVMLTAGMVLFYAGMGLLYGPVVDTVLGTVAAEESGRGIGMNDLVMNVSPSIGVSIFGGMMGSGAFNAGSITGMTGPAATYSTLFLLYGACAVAGLVLFLLIRKGIEESAA